MTDNTNLENLGFSGLSAFRHRVDKDFMSFFNPETGMYFRTGILKNGKDTGVDPFMSSFPELLDVGVMGHCIHGSKGLCLAAGVECYQNGLSARNPNMSLEDFRRICSECSGKTYQIALGGCGDPDQHESFREILETCREFGIVPNFTTSGLGMTEEIARLCWEHCGAVAVSWYRSDYTIKAIETLINAGVKTNIHYVLSKSTVAEALDRLKNRGFPEGINAVVFLLHKPVGLGRRENMVTKDNRDFKELINYIGTQEMNYKIGFDSCSVPALVNNPGNIMMESLDTCEGGRWSAYITPDMKMLPCSFDNQEQRWAVDLRTHTLKEAWDSPAFEAFRGQFRVSCPNCAKRSLCMGGCPIVPDIVLCDRSEYLKVS